MSIVEKFVLIGFFALAVAAVAATVFAVKVTMDQPMTFAEIVRYESAGESRPEPRAVEIITRTIRTWGGGYSDDVFYGFFETASVFLVASTIFLLGINILFLIIKLAS